MNSRTTNFTPVLDAYEHALMGRFPRARYWVGKEAPIFKILRIVPTWLFDFLWLSIAPKPVIAALKK